MKRDSHSPEATSKLDTLQGWTLSSTRSWNITTGYIPFRLIYLLCVYVYVCFDWPLWHSSDPAANHAAQEDEPPVRRSERGEQREIGAPYIASKHHLDVHDNTHHYTTVNDSTKNKKGKVRIKYVVFTFQNTYSAKLKNISQYMYRILKMFLTFQRPYLSAKYPAKTPQTMKPRNTIWDMKQYDRITK